MRLEEIRDLANRIEKERLTMALNLSKVGASTEQNLHRIYAVRDMGFNPYVMVYDKPNAPAIIKRLQRWVNNKKIFGLCRKFEDYQ